MDKNQVANLLDEIASLLELKEESNPFEVRAYQNAARAVNGLDGDIEQLTREGKLKGVPGLGSTIIKRIEESPVEFDLSPAKIEELHKRRVTDTIISAMTVAMGDK